MNKRIIGLVAGIAVAAIIMLLPLAGLSAEGKTCLALSLMTVVFWATNVAQSGFVGFQKQKTKTYHLFLLPAAYCACLQSPFRLP